MNNIKRGNEPKKNKHKIEIKNKKFDLFYYFINRLWSKPFRSLLPIHFHNFLY